MHPAASPFFKRNTHPKSQIITKHPHSVHTNPSPAEKQGFFFRIQRLRLCRFQLKKRNSCAVSGNLGKKLLYVVRKPQQKELRFDVRFAPAQKSSEAVVLLQNTECSLCLYGQPSQLSHRYTAFSDTNPVLLFSCFVPTLQSILPALHTKISPAS